MLVTVSVQIKFLSVRNLKMVGGVTDTVRYICQPTLVLRKIEIGREFDSIPSLTTWLSF